MMPILFPLALALLGPPSPPPSTAAAPTVLRLYLARHGQTEWNRQKKLQGRSDIPLNETGRAQARSLAARLVGVPLDAVYTSGLQRTRETAEALGRSAPVTALPSLDEQALGAFEGLLLTDTARYAEFTRRQEDPSDAMDGGESQSQHLARVAGAVADIRSRHPRGGTVLVVGHGGTNALVLRTLLSLTAAESDVIEQANDEVYLLELHEDATPPRVFKLIARERLSEL